MPYRRDVEALANVIDLVARRCRNGIPALLGKKPRPTDNDVYEALEWHESENQGVKVSKAVNPDKIPDLAIRKTMVDDVIDHAGWGEIVQAVRQFAVCVDTARDWRAFQQHCLALTIRGGYQCNGGSFEKISQETEMSAPRVRRCIRRVPLQIAALALSGLSLLEEQE